VVARAPAWGKMRWHSTGDHSSQPQPRRGFHRKYIDFPAFLGRSSVTSSQPARFYSPSLEPCALPAR
jgi:hypothetical protein